MEDALEAEDAGRTPLEVSNQDWTTMEVTDGDWSQEHQKQLLQYMDVLLHVDGHLILLFVSTHWSVSVSQILSINYTTYTVYYFYCLLYTWEVFLCFKSLQWVCPWPSCEWESDRTIWLKQKQNDNKCSYSIIGRWLQLFSVLLWPSGQRERERERERESLN